MDAVCVPIRPGLALQSCREAREEKKDEERVHVGGRARWEGGGRGGGGNGLRKQPLGNLKMHVCSTTQTQGQGTAWELLWGCLC